MTSVSISSPFEELPRILLDLDINSFLFLRHGRTEYNLRRLIQGAIDIPLDSVGHVEARSAAEFLGTHGSINRIVASDLSRAWETAAYVAGEIGGVVEAEPNLRERDFGPLGGSAIVPGLWHSRAPGVETIDDFAARVTVAVREHARSPGCLIVAHGGVLRVIGHLVGAALAPSHLANAIPLQFKRGSSGWQVVTLAEDTNGTWETSND